MTTGPLEQHDLPPTSTVRLLMRYAVEEPELGWKQMPNRRALRFFHAGLCLPELANRVIRTADVYVRVNNRKAVGVSRIELSEWKLNAKGAVT